MALVKTIKDRLTNDTIYPITKADAVYLSDNETTVEGALGDLSTISSIGDGTIAGAISTLNNNLNFIQKTYTYSYTIAANNTFVITGKNFNVSSPIGYYPISIIAVMPSASTNNVVISRIALTAMTGIMLGIRNLTNNSISDTATIIILYAKESLIDIY